MNPLISLIIPVYNSNRTLAACFKSLQNQTYQNLEIIFIDDGSTDKSLATLKQFAKQHKQVKVYHQANKGASSARNLGIEKSTGKYICFIDADDTVAPEFVAQLYQLIKQPHTALAGTGMRRYRIRQKTSADLYQKPLRPREQSESVKTYALWLLLQDGRLYPVANKIFKANIIRQHHLKFDPTLNFAEDTKFVLQYLEHTAGEIRFITAPLYVYNLDTEKGTVGESSLHWRNWQKSFNFLEQWVGKPSLKQRELLRRVHRRWQISHKLSILRSDKPLKDKLKLIVS